MIRKDNIQRLKQEITALRRNLKTAETGILKACEIARVCPESRLSRFWEV